MTDGNGFSEVDRPAVGRRGAIVSAETLAVLATIDSGKALRVELRGRRADSVQSNISQIVSRRGLRARVCMRPVDTEHVLIWLEPKP